jgi:MFS family permease
MGTQESVMRAAVAAMAPKKKRGTAFGTMNMIYGVAWFGGSALLGILYDQTSAFWVAPAAALQLTSLPVFVLLTRRQARPGRDSWMPPSP